MRGTSSSSVEKMGARLVGEAQVLGFCGVRERWGWEAASDVSGLNQLTVENSVVQGGD